MTPDKQPLAALQEKVEGLFLSYRHAVTRERGDYFQRNKNPKDLLPYQTLAITIEGTPKEPDQTTLGMMVVVMVALVKNTFADSADRKLIWRAAPTVEHLWGGRGMKLSMRLISVLPSEDGE